jgi:predicted MPP superfamily phosphohydrolase
LANLHARADRENQWFARYRVLGPEWTKNLNEIVEEGAIDIVCLTGDIADWGRKDEYAFAAEFIQQLMEALRLTMDRFFIVPGNHDVDRSMAVPQWKRLRDNFGGVDYPHLSKWIRGISGPPFGFTDADRDGVLERTQSFNAWLSAIGCKHLLPAASPMDVSGLDAKSI